MTSWRLDKRAGPHRTLAGWLALGLLTAFCGWGMAPRHVDTVRLWQPLSPLSQPDRGQPEPWVLREQAVLFAEPVLAMLRDATQPLPLTFVLDLSDGVIREVSITSRTSSPTSSTIVQGQVVGHPPGEILLAIKQDAVAGTISLGARRWTIEYAGEGRHRLAELDLEKLPPD